jgi:transposase InsO family protein
MAGRGLPAPLATRVLGVSEPGYYEWRGRPPSARALRHAWLTEQIQAVHVASRGTCGARRIHAGLTLGLGITAGRAAVERLMRLASVRGLPGNRRPRPRHQTPTAADLVDRRFTRPGPGQLWVTGITEHPTREGKGLLRGGPGCLLPPRGGLVHRLRPDRGPGHQRPGHGDRQPPSRP